MNTKNPFPKLLTIVGVGFVWFPVLAPVIIAGRSYAADGVFRFDYLMPAELFPGALLGGGVLVCAALLIHAHRGLVLGSFGGTLAMLAAVLVLPVVTGLANGQIAPAGWPLILVSSALGLYILALVVLGVGGLLLLRDLFRPAGLPNLSSKP